MLPEGSRPRLSYIRDELGQKWGVEEKVDQGPSELGSRAKSDASVTGDMGRGAIGAPPLGSTWLNGVQGVRGLWTPP